MVTAAMTPSPENNGKPGGVHREDPGVRLRRDRLGQQRAMHSRMATRLGIRKRPQPFAMLAQPRQLFRHRAPGHRWAAPDDQTHGLAGHMGVDGVDAFHQKKKARLSRALARPWTFDLDSILLRGSQSAAAVSFNHAS